MKDVVIEWFSDHRLAVILIMVVCILIVFSVGTSGNLEHVKDQAEERFTELNYEIARYDGYQWGLWGYNDYGGAHVWYLLKKVPDNGILYSAYLQRWGDEIHLYELEAIDAIKPH